MRLYVMQLALILSACVCTMQAFGDDASIAKNLSKVLESARNEGDLAGFKLAVKVEDGTVWMSGKVANIEQRELALDKVRRVSGVRLVVNDIEVGSNQVANQRTETIQDVRIVRDVAVDPAPQTGYGTEIDDSEVAQAAAYSRVASRVPSVERVERRPAPRRQYVQPPVPVSRSPHNRRRARPVQFEEEIVGGYVDGGEVYGGSSSYVDGGSTYSLGQPSPSYGGYAGGGGGYESAQLPNYAWPSYAAHPNYAGVTYPKQYSPAAWPYIGPFYPYPQVPLGWRKVSLEWDDGWWMLDFKSK